MDHTSEGSIMSGTLSSAFDVVLSDDFNSGYKSENWGNPFHGGF